MSVCFCVYVYVCVCVYVLLLKSRYFKQMVSLKSSAIKISDEVPREDQVTIDTVDWTAGLESVFKQNAQSDRQLRQAIFKYIYSRTNILVKIMKISVVQCQDVW